MIFSPFNRWKILCHRPHLEGIVSGKFLPPYCVCTDPTNFCSQDCGYCNSRLYKYQNQASMPIGHLDRLAAFYKDWGVQATIIEGGGEPFMHKETEGFIRKCYSYDIETGVITNGVMMSGYIRQALVECCRFVGISFDAGTRETYQLIRGTNDFDFVKDNVYALNKIRPRSLDVKLKFLVCEENWHEIPLFVELAKDIGCSGVHIKPVGIENVEGCRVHRAPRDVNDSLRRVEEMSDDSFTVSVVLYKFGEDLKEQKTFQKCEATPIGGVFGADGNFHLCYNQRGVYVLGRHYPDPDNIRRLWNTQKHRDLIESIDTSKCMRCGLIAANEVIERAVRKDEMFWKFL